MSQRSVVDPDPDGSGA